MSDCSLEFISQAFTSNDSRRSAVIAHWWPSAEFNRSVHTLVSELCRTGFAVTVVSSCPSRQPLDFLHSQDAAIRVLRRENRGHDFGSWSNAIRFDPAILDSEEVLIANDSLVGPFTNISDLLNASTTADVEGLTISTETGRQHVQSYWLHHFNSVSQSPGVLAFWTDESKSLSKRKNEIVHDYEIGYSELLLNSGYSLAAKFKTERSWFEFENPTIAEWRYLLHQGMPFVKRELLWKPGLGPGSPFLVDEVRRQHGVNVWDWLPDRGADERVFFDTAASTKLASLHSFRSWPPVFSSEYQLVTSDGQDCELHASDSVDFKIAELSRRISLIWIVDFSPTLSKRVHRAWTRWRRRLQIARSDPVRAARKLRFIIRK